MKKKLLEQEEELLERAQHEKNQDKRIKQQEILFILLRKATNQQGEVSEGAVGEAVKKAAEEDSSRSKESWALSHLSGQKTK